MKAVQLTLICHGLTDAQRLGQLACPDDALVTLPSAAQWVADYTRIVAAPEHRTLATADVLGDPILIEPALADCDLGCWQGLALKQLQREQPDALAQWLSDPCSAPHGGESLAQLSERVTAWLSVFDSPGTTLAVTHPLVIRAVLGHLLDCPLAALQRIDVLPLAKLQLSFNGQWRLRLV